jgi:lipoic acid synthetase
VPRLYTIRPGAEYGKSLKLLEEFKQRFRNVKTKSGLMVGLGETENEIEKVMEDLVGAGCEILSIGQYLSPGSSNTPVIEYIEPEQFEKYATTAKKIGFKSVFSGPFVRSSYLADSILIH